MLFREIDQRIARRVPLPREIYFGGIWVQVQCNLLLESYVCQTKS